MAKPFVAMTPCPHCGLPAPLLSTDHARDPMRWRMHRCAESEDEPVPVPVPVLQEAHRPDVASLRRQEIETLAGGTRHEQAEAQAMRQSKEEEK